ncbi:MAG TPA: carboxy terminal-processing peptidase [Ignavibacteriaceae bacterium]|nr:carboxy terminal-processing peptidase [Ignavibacteriaceae bacterium]
MKKIALLLSLTLAAIFFANPFEIKHTYVSSNDTLRTLQPRSYYSEEDKLINTILNRYHYRKFQLNDSLSSVIFDRFIKSLDFNRSYFLESDIENIEKYRNELDDDLKEGNLEPAYEIFKLYRDRVNERIDFVNQILKNEFDFTINETFQADREKADWPAGMHEMDEIWRKRVKNDALNLKLSGKNWDSSVETLKSRFENLRRAVNQYNDEDVFQLLMNSYTESIDPHTNYLSPNVSDNFKIDMKRSLEGIGAQLQTEDEYTKVADLIPGGPAYKSKLLHRNDKIIGVAQGEEGEMVDVIGWRITDVVQLIRGPKGTVVRLQILPAEEGSKAVAKEIKLIREKVTLEDQSAKKDILEIDQNNHHYKFGIITVPAFYIDFEEQQRGEKNYKSTTRDVRKLLKELKAENVDGILIDLRNNGGGSLSEAVQMTGLFIKDGPVVQVRNADGSVDVDEDPSSDIAYSGPLAVLVNKFSASASEIFSGAIQDYGRGLIIGEQTYGKGTVQNLIDLNRLMGKPSEDLGQVKLTIAKYYRITGGSTQNLGVIPDISFPSAIDSEEFGESSEPSALPYDRINSTKFTKAGDLQDVLSELLKKHRERVKNNPEYNLLLQDIDELKTQKENKFVSLNESIRKKEKDDLEDKRFRLENEWRSKQGLKLLQKGEKAPEEENKKSDFILDEGANILADLINLTTG